MGKKLIDEGKMNTEVMNRIVPPMDHRMISILPLSHLLEQAVGHRRFVTGTIADVMTGRSEVDRSKPAIFSPFGLGILDLAVGKWVYDQAVATGQDLRLTDFFYDMSR